MFARNGMLVGNGFVEIDCGVRLPFDGPDKSVKAPDRLDPVRLAYLRSIQSTTQHTDCLVVRFQWHGERVTILASVSE